MVAGLILKGKGNKVIKLVTLLYVKQKTNFLGGPELIVGLGERDPSSLALPEVSTY